MSHENVTDDRHPYVLQIRPCTPTVLDTIGQTTVKLPGYELWMNYIENVYIVPTCMDTARLGLALGETLQVCPHAAGELRRSEIGEWEIHLANSTVPIEVNVLDNVVSLQIGEDDWVIQPSLGHFYAQRRRGAFPSDDSTGPYPSLTPLLLLKVTVANQETAIGVSWHHTLGDAMVLLRFMQLLSERYQGLKDTYVPLPTFSKRIFPRPTDLLLEQFTPLMPHLAQTCPIQEVGRRYAEMNQDTSRIAFRVTTGQLSKLRGASLDDHDLRTADRPSLHAYLIALIINTLNRHLPVPVEMVTNAVSYRGVSETVNEANVAGNAIFIVPAALEKGDSSIQQIAHKVYHAIKRAREPSFVDGYMSVASHKMLSAVNAGHTWLFAAAPGRVSVNSNTAIDWHTAHFGFPNNVKFYTSGLNDRYIRVFWSNPSDSATYSLASELADEPAPSNRSMDVFFAVASDLRDRVLEDIKTALDGL